MPDEISGQREFPFPSINLLRQSGYEIISISEKLPGISDFEVIEKAKAEGLIILTFDKDYGEIIFKHGHESPPSVVFFRFKGDSPEIAGKLLTDLLENKKLDVANKFSVIEKENVRQRAYS